MKQLFTKWLNQIKELLKKVKTRRAPKDGNADT